MCLWVVYACGGDTHKAWLRGPVATCSPLHPHARTRTHSLLCHPFTVKTNFPFSGKVPHPYPTPLPRKAEAGSLGLVGGGGKDRQAGLWVQFWAPGYCVTPSWWLAVSDPPLLGKSLSVWLPLDGLPSAPPPAMAVSPPALTMLSLSTLPAQQHNVPCGCEDGARTLWDG